MKQFISWGILFLFLANIGGFFFVFKIQEYAIKRDIKTKIKQGVPENELYTFVLTDDNQHEFEWEHSKEFEYKGLMYDVVYKTNNPDGSVTLQCVSDVQETQLFKNLENYLSSSILSSHNGKHPIVEFHLFLSHLFLENNPMVLPYLSVDPSPYFPSYLNFYNSSFSSKLLDPPRA